MDNPILVTVDFAIGSRILKALDDFGMKLSIAMWLRLPEYDDWPFLAASRRLDAAAPAKAYGLIHEGLEKAGIPLELVPPLMILKMTDPFIRSLRRIFRESKSVEGMRLGGQMIGGRFVDDAVVYRIQ